ncbi:HAD family phosphatase [Candidatus Micrarchaeota archaeon]|nr:HAD family phosphatase [Candidatus Micrarchaeota archaeon]
MIKAVLFDFDGVIVQSEELHKQTFLEVLLPNKIDVEDRWYHNFAGTGSGKIFQALLKEYHIKGDVKELVEKRRDLFMAKIKKGITETPGLKPFLAFLREKNIKTAIVSGGHSSYIKKLNHMLGISFDFIVSADEIKERKPDPAPFLIAAKALNVSPENCLVIEDSYSGCEAARRANMKLVWVRPHESMNAPDCDLVVDDFKDKKILDFF